MGNPDVVSTNQTANPSTNYTFNDAIFACSIDARWAPMKPFMMHYFDNVVGSDYLSELEGKESEFQADPH